MQGFYSSCRSVRRIRVQLYLRQGQDRLHVCESAEYMAGCIYNLLHQHPPPLRNDGLGGEPRLRDLVTLSTVTADMALNFRLLVVRTETVMHLEKLAIRKACLQYGGRGSHQE